MRPYWKALLCLCLAPYALPAFAADPPPICDGASCSELVYFGTRAQGSGQGIFAAHFDAASGRLSPIGLVAELARPTWLLKHPALPVLYSVSEVGNDGATQASVLSYTIDAASGALRPQSRTASGGGGATHLAFDANANALFVANYGTGQVAWLPTANDGALGIAVAVQSDYGTGPNPRQKSPHAHGLVVDPAHRYVLCADLGADRIFVYRFDAAKRLFAPAEPASVSLPPGSGPRHLAFHPNGRFVYVVTELSAEVFVFRWDAAHGSLKQVQRVATSSLGFDGKKSASHIEVSGDGRYVYVSNRGENLLLVYAVDANTGTLREVQRIATPGQAPWSFALHASGRWLLVADNGSNAVSVFAVDPHSGRLSPTDTTLPVPQVSAISFADTVQAMPNSAVP